SAAWLSGRVLGREDLYIWFGADSLALIIFVPIFRGFGSERWRKLRERWWQFGSAVGAIVGLSVISGLLPHVPTLRLMLLPLFALIAFDLGVAGVEISLAALLLTWSLLTIAGYPVTPWVEADTRSQMVVLQIFAAVFTATALPLAVVIEEKQR